MSDKMVERKRANLGRGLAALLGDDEVAGAAVGHADDADNTAVHATDHVAIACLQPNPYQPRQAFDEETIAALAESISANGVLQPLLVRERPGDEDSGPSYEIIAGERRWRAAERAGLSQVPVVVRKLSDSAALEIAIVENVQRRDLTPLEEARGYERLLAEFGHSQDDLARVVGRSRSHISNMLRLLQLPEPVKARVQAGDISAGHARALLNASDPENLADDVARRGLSVRETEKLAQDVKAGGEGTTGETRARSRTSTAKDADLKALEKEVSTELGLKIRIAAKGEGGTVTLHYTSPEQRDDMLHRLRYGPDRTDPTMS